MRRTSSSANFECSLYETMSFPNRAFIFILFLYACSAAEPLGQYCNKDAKISSRSQVSTNIAQLLAELTASAGYLATSFGKGQDRVYGLAQCRGDVSSQDCSNCLKDAAKEIQQRCPDQADARIWYDYCFLRYSKEDFIGKLDTSYDIVYFNVENVTDPGEFNEKLGGLVDEIRSQALVLSNEGLGKGKTELSPLVTLYALVQCTRDLAPIDCAQCVAIAAANNFCSNRKGCRALYSNCYYRYELYPFFFPLDSSNSPAGTSIAIAYP